MIHQEWDTKPHDMKQKLIGRISMDNYRLRSTLCYTSLLHAACLWANEVLSRTSQRVKDGIGHVGTRDPIPRISFRKKADIDENKKEAFFVLM